MVYFVHESWIFGHGLELFLLLLAVADICTLFDLLDASYIEITLCQHLTLHIVDQHHSCDSYPITWYALRHIAAVNYDVVGTGHLACGDLVRKLLDAHGLSIDYLGGR